MILCMSNYVRSARAADIDVSGIKFKVKGGHPAGPGDSFSYDWTRDLDGNARASFYEK